MDELGDVLGYVDMPKSVAKALLSFMEPKKLLEDKHKLQAHVHTDVSPVYFVVALHILDDGTAFLEVGRKVACLRIQIPGDLCGDVLELMGPGTYFLHYGDVIEASKGRGEIPAYLSISTPFGRMDEYPDLGEVIRERNQESINEGLPTSMELSGTRFVIPMQFGWLHDVDRHLQTGVIWRMEYDNDASVLCFSNRWLVDDEWMELSAAITPIPPKWETEISWPQGFSKKKSKKPAKKAKEGRPKRTPGRRLGRRR
jgi:hypothetical protein